MIFAIVPIVIIQGLNHIRPKTLILWGIFLSLCCAGLCYYQYWKGVVFEPIQISLLEVFLLVFLPIGHTLVICSDLEQRFRPSYQTLFDNSWKLVMQLILTLAFVALVWSTFFIGVMLLNLINLDFLSLLLFKEWFVISLTVISTAIGIHLTDALPSVIRNLRNLILNLLSSLLPLLVFFTLIFLIGLIWLNPRTFFEQNHITTTLLFVDLGLIFLINVVYQDGADYKDKSILIQYSCKLAALILPFMVAITTYGFYLEVAQYGLSIPSIFVGFTLLIFSVFSLCYMVAFIGSVPWLKLIESCNFYTAYLIILISIALLTPIADPSRLMVANQIYRLSTHQVSLEKFDLNYVSNNGNRYAKKALEGFNFKNLPKTGASQVKTPAARVLELIAHPQNDHLPPSFLEQQWGDNIIANCSKYQKCHAWQMSIEQSPIIIIYASFLSNNSMTSLLAFQQNQEKKWQTIGQWILLSQCSQEYLSEIILNNPFEWIETSKSIPDLKIKDIHFEFISQNDNLCHQH
jgi:hypothetical protein